ncbi:hypothetical protein CEXT_561781 [Caerostris extrusa]|uniref:Uncharacterized protein n=1 Tax=Caerostris extrusa TaxID=172846 RepID=A0AAV4RDR8_CAEEX|nr:hypothetical protein CEXT_561781 [Caerostris extrusa]
MSSCSRNLKLFAMSARGQPLTGVRADSSHIQPVLLHSSVIVGNKIANENRARLRRPVYVHGHKTGARPDKISWGCAWLAQPAADVERT